QQKNFKFFLRRNIECTPPFANRRHTSPCFSPNTLHTSAKQNHGSPLLFSHRPYPSELQTLENLHFVLHVFLLFLKIKPLATPWQQFGAP
ncbi:hypothetical protein, partial [Hallella sp.]|uniref:hypothetical protein n=1 Tax=Hallella sp. TaxID=2980186 RepID=UPI00307FE3CC